MCKCLRWCHIKQNNRNWFPGVVYARAVLICSEAFWSLLLNKAVISIYWTAQQICYWKGTRDFCLFFFSGVSQGRKLFLWPYWLKIAHKASTRCYQSIRTCCYQLFLSGSIASNACCFQKMVLAHLCTHTLFWVRDMNGSWRGNREHNTLVTPEHSKIDYIGFSVF